MCCVCSYPDEHYNAALELDEARRRADLSARLNA